MELAIKFDQCPFLAGSRSPAWHSQRLLLRKLPFRIEVSVAIADPIETLGFFRENTDTESFSATRHRLRLRYFHQLGASAEIGSSLEFRDSDYKGVSGDDRRARVRLEYQYRFDATWGAQTEVTYTDNDSNQSDSRYHKYQALVSINALF